MNILKSILKILIILINILSFGCREKNTFPQNTYTFNSLYYDLKTFPIYPQAFPDYSYAKVGVYVFSYIYGWDPKNRIIYSYYTDDKLENVKKFFEEKILIKFSCEIEDHEEFMRRYWDLFQEFEFPNFEGYFEHCKGEYIDLISPFYHYGKLRWESGTIIVYRIENPK